MARNSKIILIALCALIYFVSFVITGFLHSGHSIPPRIGPLLYFVVAAEIILLWWMFVYLNRSLNWLPPVASVVFSAIVPWQLVTVTQENSWLLNTLYSIGQSLHLYSRVTNFVYLFIIFLPYIVLIILVMRFNKENPNPASNNPTHEDRDRL